MSCATAVYAVLGLCCAGSIPSIMLSSQAGEVTLSWQGNVMRCQRKAGQASAG